MYAPQPSEGAESEAEDIPMVEEDELVEDEDADMVSYLVVNGLLNRILMTICDLGCRPIHTSNTEG